MRVIARLLPLLLATWGSVLQGEELPEWLGDDTAGVAPADMVLATGAEARWFVEAAGYRVSHDRPTGHDYTGDLGLDGRLVQPLGAQWSGEFNARIDLDVQSGQGVSSENLSVTLRELYLAGHQGVWSLDLGRMNIRDGVSPNFNPSDVFRIGALTARRTENPARLRESRLGVVGARLQGPLAGGSISAMAVPPLATPDDPHWYDPKWAAVNDGQAQGYLNYVLPGWNGFYSNALVHWQEGGATTYGFNLANNIGQALVASLEFASTKNARLPDLAQSADAPAQRYSQLALALSYSTTQRQTLTLEYDYNGGGLSRSEWLGVWQTQDSAGLQRAFAESGRRQDPLGVHNLMGMLQWDRFLNPDSQLDLLVQYNLVDRSRMVWTEWRYQLPNAELALNLTWMQGDPRSQYGAPDSPLTLGSRVRVFF